MIDMPEGLELDELIATKVMGYEKDNMRDGWVRIGALSTYPKKYSTDWNDMRLVVEEMRRRNWQIVLNDDLDKWTAIFFWDPNGESYECKEDTAPHAVCLAALSALAALEGESE